MSEPVAICGQNRFFQPLTVGGCGAPILTVGELYRCADCSVPFHRDCLRAHFTKVITDEDVARESGGQ